MGIRHYIGLLVLLLLIAATPLAVRNDYYLGLLVFAGLNCLACIGLSLLMGYAGQISLGHAAFIGIGAYVSGYLTVRMDVGIWPAMVAGVGACMLMALVIGVPALKLRGHYLAMATLGFGEIVYIVAVAAIGITGGPEGINSIPKLHLFNYVLKSDTRFFYFTWAMVFLGLFFALNLIHSRVGRGLMAVHGSEDAAGSLGVNTARYKIQVFVLSAVYAGLAGCLYAHYVNYIDPGPFGVMHSVLLVTMVAVGGIHHIWGAVGGALFLSLLPDMLSLLSEYFEGTGIQYRSDYDTLVYGAILLLVMLFLPEGIAGGLNDLLKKAKQMVRPGTAGTEK
ncbi:branched-chain amino acid ABC transporter permease [Desulfosudis oleivorans]|uniref:Inner-membrane translocator n=1 Tax=Desulfosudis oleivorans (strain DSM 6200 / JCM 39069 / Hxd3) TaxID=96561 RepID=A8ZVT6_DESOH|nr:branched-chain amino acid ABC transporter permease [Desulfosudis oleivorans]ABW66645.1 inner-membrane translocator [Desulfosudis oleivorans Hxd3]